jgi:hypothetical protein
MRAQPPRYTKEEHARLGTELYESRVRPLVEAGNHGRIVAIDIDSGEYKMAANTLMAAELLLARRPDSQIWCVCIGSPAVYRFGPRLIIGRS